MKKLLLFLMFLAVPAYAIETTVVGTMWKQEGTVVSPADDVTSVEGVGGGCAEGADCGFGNITGSSLKVGDGSAANPSVAIGGDGDTGLYAISSDTIGATFAGAVKWDWRADRFAAGNGPYLKSGMPSSTNIPFTFTGDTNSGYTKDGVGIPLIMADGVKAFRAYTTYSEFYPSGTGQVRIDDKGSISAAGAVAFPGITTITANYAIGNFVDDPIWFIECDAALGNISTTLPPFADKKGRLLGIKLMSAANGCYLDGNGAETIDGVAGKAITTQYNVINLIAGSLGWLIK